MLQRSATVADVEKTLTLPRTPRLILLGVCSELTYYIFTSDELLKLSVLQLSMNIILTTDI